MGGREISYDRLVYKSYMCAYRHSRTYTKVTYCTFGKVRRKSEPRMRMVSCACSYLQESPVEVQIPTHWNLIGRSMIAPTTVLSPSSILPPPSSPALLIPHGKFWCFY